MHHDQAIEWFVGALLLLCGLSQMLGGAAWAALFRKVLARDRRIRCLGLLELLLGLAVVILHNAWGWGIPGIVTLLGWIWLLESLIYLVAPALVRRLGAEILDLSRLFAWTGAFLAPLGAAILLHRAGVI